MRKNGERVMTATMELEHATENETRPNGTGSGTGTGIRKASSGAASASSARASSSGNASAAAVTAASDAAVAAAADITAWQPAGHSVCTGSWQSLFWVYLQAVRLALHQRFTFYPYAAAVGAGEGDSEQARWEQMRFN